MDIEEAIRALPDSPREIAQFLVLNGYKGFPEQPDTCPLAAYLKKVTGRKSIWVHDYVEDDTAWYEALEQHQSTHNGSSAYFPGGPEADRYELTDAAKEFITAFDHGEYPNLIAEKED
jgi:hypothetical protein